MPGNPSAAYETMDDLLPGGNGSGRCSPRGCLDPEGRLKTNIFKNHALREDLLFLGFAVPDEIMEAIVRRDRYPQIAAHKFQWHIIHGVEAASGSAMSLISAVPVISCYPKYPDILFRGGRWKHREDAQDRFLPFVNIPILKHLTRFFSAVMHVSRWLRGHRGDPKIIIYAMHSPLLLAAVIATMLFRGKIYLVIPDMPEYMDVGIRRGFFRKVGKKIDGYLMNRMLKKMTGLIVLSKYVAEDGFSGRIPYLVVEGAVSPEIANGHREPSSIPLRKEKIIMYTGSLAALDLLIDGFRQIPDHSYRLWISGRGEMEKQISELSGRDERVIYWGLLSNEEISKKMLQATALINARSAKTPHIQYSFPSKLLEYMLAGRPVISTALPGIPEDYYDYLYILKDESPQALASFIQEVCSKPPQELREFGERARRFVMAEKNYRRQGKRIYEFMQSL